MEEEINLELADENQSVEKFIKELNQISYLSESENDINKSQLDFKYELEKDLRSFYSRSISKSAKNVTFNVESCDDLNVLDENFELNYEKSFKEIFKFSRQQAAKLDKKLSTLENKQSRKRLEEFDYKSEHRRLGKLLESKNFKDQGAFKDLDNESDYESDDDIERDFIKSKHLNKLDNQSTNNSSSLSQKFYENYSKKYSTQIEKFKLRTKIIRSMYNKSILNQEKSKKFRFYSANTKLGNIITPKNDRIIRSFKAKSQILNEESYNKLVNHGSNSKNSAFSKNNLRENLKNDLKISSNPYNTNLEVFLIR